MDQLTGHRHTKPRIMKFNANKLDASGSTVTFCEVFYDPSQTEYKKKPTPKQIVLRVYQ